MSFYERLKTSLSGLRFESPRLRIREFQNSDEEGLFTLFHDDYTMLMDGDLPILEKNDEFYRRINLIKSGSLIWYFLESKANGDFIGFVMLQPVSDPEEKAVAVGYSLTAAYQRQGCAREALLSLFEVLKAAGVEYIFANIWEQNLPSQKLVKRLGFQEYGRTNNAYRNPITGERSAHIHFRVDL